MGGCVVKTALETERCFYSARSSRQRLWKGRPVGRPLLSIGSF